jgi:hypothetical protein
MGPALPRKGSFWRDPARDARANGTRGGRADPVYSAAGAAARRRPAVKTVSTPKRFSK